MANGRVITGFSDPWVAEYAVSGGTVTYSNAMALARGVEVSLSPESSDDNKFYADNIVAENATGMFTGGTVTLTVDGLKDAARKLIFGLPTAVDNWTAYDNTIEIPYVGIGFIVRYMEDGATTYMPVVLAKTMFQLDDTSAATQEDEIDWQTQELTATLFRDDSATQAWKFVGTAQTTQALALGMMKTKLGVA